MYEENKIDAILKEWWDFFTEREGKEKELTGIPTGIPTLDAETDGIQKGEYWVIGGDTRIGKTTFALNLALHIARRNYNIIYFITEMGRIRIAEKILGIQTGIDTKLLHKGELSSSEAQKILNIINNIKYNFWIFAGHIFATDDIIRIVETFDIKPHIIFVDYIQQMLEAQGIDPVVGLSRASFRFQELAKTKEIAVVVLSQITKEAQKRKDIETWALKGSSTISQNADVVLLLHRKYLSTKEKSILTIKMDKVRYGEQRVIRTVFDLASGRIGELDARTMTEKDLEIEV